MGVLNEKRCKNENFNGTLINKELISIIPVITCIITDVTKDV